MKKEVFGTDFIIMGISAFIYILLIAGLALIFKDTFRSYYDRMRMRNRLRGRKQDLREESSLERHLNQVLGVSLKKKIKPSTFLAATGLVFTVIFTVGMQNISFHQSLLVAIFISAMPYLLLRVRLETIRRKGSFEGEQLVSEFLSQYRIHEFNIYKAIEYVILECDGMKISSKLLFKLLIQIRNTGAPQVIKAATDEFAYGIDTNWSRMLANNIRISAERGTNISFALEDILIQLRGARAAAEERKRLNGEALRMVLFVVPIMYLGTIFMSVRYLDLSVKEFILNQFYTAQGFLLFTAIIFLFLMNLAIVEMVQNQRFDY